MIWHGRQQLEVYWKGVMGVERIHEFHKHYSSDELKRFLDVTNILANRSTEAAQAPQNNEEDNSALTGQVNTEDDNENEAAGDSGLKGQLHSSAYTHTHIYVAVTLRIQNLLHKKNSLLQRLYPS